jgi:HEPN domain-containing protein
MKQTAVEWLSKELLREHPIQTNHDVIKQAKEIEKQQIIDAYQEAITNGFYDEDAEQYYNEKFNK